jgi:PAS domain S-box-containing protein
MNENILVVDDEESIRFTFKSFLSDEGYNVSTATGFRDALGKLAEGDFHMIFADIILGGKTGIHLLEAIKSRKLSCPVVMITGAPDLETAAKAIRLGAFDYIPKPVRQDTLIHVAGKAIQHKQLIDEKEQYRSNLEAIFRSVKDAIITVDPELRVIEINEAAENICGYSRDAIGREFGALPKSCNGGCLQALNQSIKQREPVEIERFECKRHEQNRQIVTLTTSPLLDSHGVFAGAVLVVKDETRLAHLERDLDERRQFHKMVGKSEKMQRVFSLLEDLADIESIVLITGESGTGKELVAEALHYTGIRSAKPLVKVNCSALPETLLETELFGHVKGAFTGAIRDKVGRFQRADGGTLFLDEIGDISPRMQLRLLRVLQESEFERVGDSRPIKVNVRVVAATNQNLRGKVSCGEFREDLFYRLNVVEVPLPPLRERRDDIPLLVAFFMKKYNQKLRKNIRTISEEVEKMFMEYPWPGNVRELEHTLEHAFIVCRDHTIRPDHLPSSFTELIDRQGHGLPGETDAGPQAILAALEKTGWNKSKAARLLGIGRRTIYRKIEEFNLEEPGKE